MNVLLEAARKISGKDIYIKEGPKWIHLNYREPHIPGFEYTFARINKETGGIYSASGKVARGNINDSLHGTDIIGKYGVTVGKTKQLKTANTPFWPD